MEETEAASQRTFRFVCGCRNEDLVPTRATEPTLKRQRVAKPWIVQVELVELICTIDEANEDNDKHFGLFVWPSALLLAQFIAREANWLCRGKVLLELGCGTGLPSILSGLCEAAKVYLTDRADAADVQRNAEVNIQLNGLQGRAEFLPLVWGDMFVSNELLSVFQTVEIILAADCFYQSEDFEKVIATVALIFRCSGSTSCKFVFSYQLRSINRSIAPLLSRWGLEGKILDKRDLLNDVESSQDFDSIFLYECFSSTG
ncbi:hypothetical protein V7S43_005143 [Phytophthora oleae]|uniref:Uncharacterized protein n=1 Tax=Phytophthora oleae TaxID=2107226 RepID=A0ABD3FTS1_9STRA